MELTALIPALPNLPLVLASLAFLLAVRAHLGKSFTQEHYDKQFNNPAESPESTRILARHANPSILIASVILVVGICFSATRVPTAIVGSLALCWPLQRRWMEGEPVRDTLLFQAILLSAAFI